MRTSAPGTFEALVREKLSVLVHGTDHHIYQFSNDLFARIGITTQQAVALMYISFHKGCNQKALENFMRTKSASVTVLLSTMIGKGIVEKRPNPVDARGILLSLTPKGKRTAIKCREIFQRLNAVVRNGISDEEIVALKRLLRKMIDNCIEAEEEMKTAELGASDKPRESVRRKSKSPPATTET